MDVDIEGNPFVGPRPFERADIGGFFGREREVRELVSLVFSHRVVVLYAASGSGKTSLLNAGLMPALEQDEEFDVLPVARVRGLKSDVAFPTEARNVYVFNVISNWAEGLTDVAKMPTSVGGARRKRISRGPTEPRPTSLGRPAGRSFTHVSLSEFLGERPHPLTSDGFPAPRAVLFDQFEELFRLHPEHWPERGAFFEQVADALRQDDLLRVVFAMREEYLAELDKHRARLPGPPALFRLERLGFDAALAAVTGPIRNTHRSFAPDVAENLVRNLMKFRVDTGTGDSVEVDGEAVEPVQLQVVCHSLWAELPPDVQVLTESQVRAFGNVDDVLARFYTETISAAAAKAQVSERELRVWFEKQFITAMGTRSTVYRTRLSTAGMTNDAIDELEARHLIRAEWRAGARWYELTHDRLIAPVRASNRSLLYEPVGVDAEEDAWRRASQVLARAETAWLESRADDVEAYHREAIRIYESFGDNAAVANTLMRMVELYLRSDDLSRARPLALEAGNIYRTLDDILGWADSRRALGLIERGIGMDDESLVLLEQALGIYRAAGEGVGAAWTLLSMSDVHEGRGDFDTALDLAAQALELFEDGGERFGVAVSLETLGALEFGSGKGDAALEHYEKAKRIHTELGDLVSVAVMLARSGEVYFEQEDYERAVACFTEATKFTPDDLGLYSQRAVAQWYAGRHDDAIEDYSRILKSTPHDADAYNGRGQNLAELGRYKQALKDLEQALQLSDDSVLEAYIRNGRALALAGLGRYEDAFQEFDASLRLAPDNGFAFYNRAAVHQSLGETLKAAKDFARALNAHGPPLPRAKRDRARAVVSSGVSRRDGVRP